MKKTYLHGHDDFGYLVEDFLYGTVITSTNLTQQCQFAHVDTKTGSGTKIYATGM